MELLANLTWIILNQWQVRASLDMVPCICLIAPVTLPSIPLIQLLHEQSVRAELICSQTPPEMVMPPVKHRDGKSWTYDSEIRYENAKSRPSLAVFCLREAIAVFPELEGIEEEFQKQKRHHYAYDLHKNLLAFVV